MKKQSTTTPTRTKKSAPQPRSPLKNPLFGRANPKRGLLHRDTARLFVAHFGFPEKAIKRKDIDAYLIAQGHMPTEATDLERYSHRTRFLTHLRTASVSPRMRELGLEPFNVHCDSSGWIIEPLKVNAARATPARKLFIQAKRSARQQRHIMQTLDPVLDQKAYLQGVITIEVTGVHEQLAQGMETFLQESHDRVKGVFDYLEQLRLHAPTLAQIPQETPA